MQSVAPNNRSNPTSNNALSSLDTKSKWAIAALAVVAAASVALLCLGATNFFGDVGSLNFIATVAGGGAGILICAGVITFIVLKARNNSPVSGSSSGVARSQAGAPSSRAPRVVKPYSELALQTIAHVRSLIQPDTLSAQLNGNGPVNPEIAKLVTLRDEAWKKFFQALQQFPNDPWASTEVQTIIREESSKALQGQNAFYNRWSSKAAVDAVEQRVRELRIQGIDPWNQNEVLFAAQDLMRIGFVISVLTLDDLPAFTAKMTTQKTYAQSLSRQDSYMYKTFYHCPVVYHILRGRSVCTDPKGEGQFGNLPGKYVPAFHLSLFTTPGTFQSDWLKLHNEYCDRVRQYVDEAELQKEESRHVAWSQKDDGTFNFRIEPTSRPT